MIMKENELEKSWRAAQKGCMGIMMAGASSKAIFMRFSCA